jgi:hypothetical protein
MVLPSGGVGYACGVRVMTMLLFVVVASSNA